MKLLIVLALMAAAVARPDDGGYDSKYNNFNIDEVISNDRLLKGLLHCFMEDGKCTPEGKDIRSWIPDAFQTSCGKCSEKQKVLVAKCIEAIKVKFPEEYTVLLKKTDPEDKYADNLKNFLEKYAS